VAAAAPPASQPASRSVGRPTGGGGHTQISGSGQLVVSSLARPQSRSHKSSGRSGAALWAKRALDGASNPDSGRRSAQLALAVRSQTCALMARNNRKSFPSFPFAPASWPAHRSAPLRRRRRRLKLRARAHEVSAARQRGCAAAPPARARPPHSRAAGSSGAAESTSLPASGLHSARPPANRAYKSRAGPTGELAASRSLDVSISRPLTTWPPPPPQAQQRQQRQQLERERRRKS